MKTSTCNIFNCNKTQSHVNCIFPLHSLKKHKKKLVHVSRKFANKSGGNKYIAQPKSERTEEKARERNERIKTREAREEVLLAGCLCARSTDLFQSEAQG